MKPTQRRWTLALLAVLAIGALLRLAPLAWVGFREPFNLGGLFYEFSRQILEHGFALPVEIPYYSAGGIPFAYPPLPFYVQAVLLKLVHPPLFVTVNLLPPLTALFSLPAFYWMMRQYSQSRPLVLASLVAFAIMPVAYSGQIEAGGLAEAFGLLAILLYLGCLFRFEREPGWVTAALAGCFLGLCVLSSPGSAYAAAVLSLLFFAKVLIAGIRGRSYAPAAWLLLTAMVGLLLSSPYWLTITSRFGADMFIRPLKTEYRLNFASSLQTLTGFSVTGGAFGFIWSWLILSGFLWAAFTRRWFVPLMLIAFWLIPREGDWLVSVPASMLAGLGAVEVVGAMLQKALSVDRRAHPDLASVLLLALLATLALVTAALSDQEILAKSNERLPPAWTEALSAMRADLPPQASVVVASGGNSALPEWAPALLEREVLNTVFGLEWQPGEVKSVHRIDDLLDAHDLAGMLLTAQQYSGKQEIYLIAPPKQLRGLLAAAPPGVSVTPIVDKGPLTLVRLRSMSQ